jgi:hypothetical protein
MANLNELNEFTAGVYQIETNDPVLGGADGITNLPLKALVNRTRWLKNQVDALVAQLATAIDEAYVQGELAKLAYKSPVRAATTTNITLSGTQTIDGVGLLIGNRVLVKNQTVPSQNGIYLVQSSAWIRSADMDADSEVQPGVAVVVSGGTSQADTIWILSTDGVINVGTSAMAWRDVTFGLAPLASPVFTGNPSGPTAPQFDNDQSLATTAFVQRALGNQSSAVVVSANRTMTAADAGAYLFSNANNLVFTLPNPSGLPLGTKFRIAQGNLTSGGSIEVPGGVTIGNITDGGTVTTVALAQSTEYVLTVVSTTAYQLTRLSAGGAFTQSLAANGWQRLPSGFIIQWGTFVNTATVTFPIAFPNACFQAVLAHTFNGSSNMSGVISVSATSFSSISSSTANRYIAVGH